MLSVVLPTGVDFSDLRAVIWEEEVSKRLKFSLRKCNSLNGQIYIQSTKPKMHKANLLNHQFAKSPNLWSVGFIL